MNQTHIITAIFVGILMCGTAAAWLPGFDYRMPIPINNTGDNLTDYQYNFTVNTATLVSAGKMNSDGSDCRITNATDFLQEFWNETAFNDSSTKIWVNASSLGNISNTTHYMYYGNSGASSVSNGTTTFITYDDFKNKFNVAGNGHSTQALHGWSDSGILYHNNKTYVFYLGSDFDEYGVVYDHVTQTWGNHVWIADGHTPDDTHNYISAGIDSNGYIYVFYGCHNTPLYYKKSTNPENISAWSAETSIDSDATYPKVVIDSNDNIYVFARSVGHSTLEMHKSTDSGGNFTTTTLINSGSNDRWVYAGRIGLGNETPNNSIHIMWGTRYGGTSDTSIFKNISYMASYDSGTTWKKASGTTYTLPATIATADVVYGGADVLSSGVGIDENNTPHLFYIKEAGGTYWEELDIYRANWNGTGWENTVLSGNNYSSHAQIFIDSANDFYVHASQDISGVIEITQLKSTDQGGNWSSSAITSSSSENNTNVNVRKYYDDNDSIVLCWSSNGIVKCDGLEGGFDTVWDAYGSGTAITDQSLHINYSRTSAESRAKRSSTMPSSWGMNFKYYHVTGTIKGLSSFGPFSHSETHYAAITNAASDLLVFNIYTGTTPYAPAGKISYVNGTSAGSSSTISISNGNTYYITLKRTNSTNAKLSMYSDIRRTTHVSGSPVSLTIPETITNLSYLTVSNYNNDEGAFTIEGKYDDTYIYNYVVPEPISSLGAEESAPSVEYIPPTPTSLANTTGNFWVNHTWAAGSGNVTDSYNVSVNAAWYNGTTVAYNNTTSSAHAWVNITVYAFNSSGNGTLSAGSVSQNTQIPNNPVTITNTTDWSGDAGNNVYVDYDAADADSDTPTFSCNRTDLFTDFSTSTGRGNWTSIAGTYYVDFGVSDGYGSTDNYTMTISAAAPTNVTITLHSVSPDTIQTNYTGEIQVNYIVESTNPLNLSTLAMLYGVNYTTTGDMHSYTAVPPNSIAADGIYRAPYRNTTPYLSWEDNATITEDNVWKWGGGDNDSTWIAVTPINATHTWINATGYPERIFQGSFYLGRRSMDTAPKTTFEVNSQQGLIIKMWDNEAIRGRSIDYLMNMYFDSDWESTIPTQPIEIWGLNSSFNPDTDDPTTSEWGAKIVEWDGNRWGNHSWIPDSNASYSYPLVFDAATFPVILDEVNYIYLKSDTQSSKSYVLNATNHDPGICNTTYAQTETMWTYNELADVSTQVAYTPSFFTTFVRDDEQFLHHLYIADDTGAWAHSDINNISIGVSHYPVEAVSFEYFNITCPTGYSHDTRMDATYNDGYIYIGIYCHADPDGGTVSHNLTIHYTNGTIAGIINDTFTTTTPGIVEINFTTSAYYSATDAYILKCVSTDDENSVANVWLDSFFTLAADGTQGYYVDDYLMFWGMNDVPTLYATIANNSLISYDAGSDIYTMHVPFFKSKCNETFRFNETVHLKSINTEDIAYFRFHGETIFDNANVYGWNTVSDTAAPTTDTYRAYMVAYGLTTGNITNSNLSYLGSDIYRQEGLNFIDNTMGYLIYNTTLSHNSRGMIMEECENFNISHCAIHDNAQAGVGIYYSDDITVENSTITDSGYDPCIYLYEASDNVIRYNIIQNCVDYGIQVRANSNNNTFTDNDVSGSGIYDYYFRASSTNNSIRDPASDTDKIRVTSTSEVNIENTDNSIFSEDSTNHTYAHPTNFSMGVSNLSQTFDITQRDMTVTPATDSIEIWNITWGNKNIAFNASNVSGQPQVWFNATRSIWANSNMTVYRNGTSYYNGTADANGTFTYNYSGGWSGHHFMFVPENVAPDKPTLVIPANGATGTSTNPTLRVHVTDPDASGDLMNVTFYAQGGTQIGSTQTGIANASTASVVWSGRSYSTTYYWYAVVDDGTAQTQGDTWHFRTQGSGSGSSHVISITGCTNWEGNAGTQVYIDFGCTGETAGATFTTNATNGTIVPSNGVYTWNTATADAGTYTWRFNVENVYSVSDYCDVTITVYHYASPTNLVATTGNFWVNHTWDGDGFADSYNVSVNDVWSNGSANQYTYHISYPHGWSNISVAAFNDTTGLSSFISNDVQVPNNAIVLTNYTMLMLATAGDNVTVDMNHEDLDGDTATYYCSRMDLFTDFNTADGTGQYTNTANGTHEVIFGVTDGYGWSNQTITIEVGTVHPLELDEETPLILFVVLVVLLFGSLFYIYHAASYIAKIVTALISTWMSFMLANMAVGGNVVINYAELSAGDVFIYGAHSIQIAALSHFFMFTGVVSALFMLVFAIKLVIDTYLDMQEKKKIDEEWDGVVE